MNASVRLHDHSSTSHHVTAPARVIRLRVSLPSVIVVVGLSADIVRLVEEVAGANAVRFVRTADEAEDILRMEVDSCVICGVPSEENEKSVAGMIRLRQQFPNASLIALFFPAISSCRAVLQLGAAGVAQIVTAAPMLKSADLQSALVRCENDSAAIRLWKVCDFHLPEKLVPVLKAAIRLAHKPISAVRLADAAGMHERSLRKYCANEGLPSPQWIIGWARLLVAGYYLDEPGRSVAHVADALEFPSACAMRNQLKRYSSVASRTLRASGTTERLARALECAVNEHRTVALRKFESTTL